jgi:hypothetical protein
MGCCHNKSRHRRRNIPAGLTVLVAAGLEVLALVAGLSAQPPVPAGITRVTLESRREAIECGKSGGDCLAPFRVCPSEHGRYSAWIATPFSRIAFSVFDALRKHERPKPLEAGDANMWGVGIYVYPSEDPDGADAIQRILIRRAGNTVEPTTTTLAPVYVTSTTGIKKELSKGFFAFPADVFAPTSEITIVFIGSAGGVNCSFDRQRLSILR